MNPEKNKNSNSDNSSNNAFNQQKNDQDILKAMRTLREHTMREAIATMKEESNYSPTLSKPKRP